MIKEADRQLCIANALESLAGSIRELSAAECQRCEEIQYPVFSCTPLYRMQLAPHTELTRSVSAVIQDEWSEIQRKAIERLQVQVEEHAKDAIHGHMDDYTLDGGELNSLMQAIARVAIYPPEVPDGGK